jgi:hypothetical protein
MLSTPNLPLLEATLSLALILPLSEWMCERVLFSRSAIARKEKTFLSTDECRGEVVPLALSKATGSDGQVARDVVSADLYRFDTQECSTLNTD